MGSDKTPQNELGNLAFRQGTTSVVPQTVPNPSGFSR
jgi:hypothetical protein